MGFGLSGAFLFLAVIGLLMSRNCPFSGLFERVENKDNKSMKKIEMTIKQAQDVRADYAQEIVIRYLLGLIARYDDRREYVD